MKIYITRHGETEWNKLGKMQGWKDSNLTIKGIEDAKKLGKSLAHIEFDKIYCSPLRRAIDTANYIKGDKNTEIIITESLKEMGFGSWEGMEYSKISESYPTQHFNFWNKPHLYKPIDGESFDVLFDRVQKVLNDIINCNNYGDNILIVTHAVVIKAIYAIIKNYSLENFWNPPFIHGTCLTILEIKDNEIQIVLEADISHLEKLDIIG
ncbi:phosphoglycerate mutase [Caloranaerobacter azorensis DSM 13643]|uniref:phosphoglycerate mutase (2,3-diphosphoglycerate-dependent) n=1 Tax=Caloranaerobacter azorensis DSM 13643 TaxID=1121264 RepID=A0A1M5T3I6_9FIRM|nr:histidine phosphatase family protein [Caloranaerobacter azorensis]SHH45160.1 phosphoglycerate mutase [Caloranaerobacter azorensis DSM 13643]